MANTTAPLTKIIRHRFTAKTVSEVLPQLERVMARSSWYKEVKEVLSITFEKVESGYITIVNCEIHNPFYSGL